MKKDELQRLPIFQLIDLAAEHTMVAMDDKSDEKFRKLASFKVAMISEELATRSVEGIIEEAITLATLRAQNRKLRKTA